MTVDDQTSRPVRPAVVLAVTSIAFFLAALDNLALNNAMPQMARDFGMGISHLQWVTTAYTLTAGTFALSASLFGRRLGGGNAYLIGLALFAAGSVAAALAPSWGVLVAGRVTQGLGGTIVFPAGSAIMRAVFTDDRSRAKASGVRAAVAGLGYAMGPVAGGMLVEWFGWRSVLWVNVPVAVAALLISLWALPRLPGVRVRWDPLGQVLAALGLGGLIYGLVQGPVDGWEAGTVLGALSVSALALPAFIIVELRTREPMLELSIFRDRAFAAASLACFTSSAGLAGTMFFLSLYLQSVLHWSSGRAGLVFLLGSGFVVLASPVAGTLSARRSPRGPMLVGAALCPLALGGLSLYGRDSSLWDSWWLLPVIGSCVGLTYVPISVTGNRLASVQRVGMVSAVVNTVEECGSVVGIAVLGAITSSRLGGALLSRATQAGVSPVRARLLVHAVISAGPAKSLVGGANLSPPVRMWVTESFLDGLHLALRCGALALAYVVAMLVLFPPRKPVSERVPEDPRPIGRQRPRAESEAGHSKTR